MSQNEFVQIVDRNNIEIGATTRREMRTNGLLHRASYVLVFNSAGELFVQKRTETKDIYPGYYDVASGGVVLAGESYKTSACRELKEELGIEGVALTPHFDLYFEDDDNRVWGRVFSCEYDGPIHLQEEEVAGGFFSSLAKVLELSEQELFTPDGLDILKRLLINPGHSLE